MPNYNLRQFKGLFFCMNLTKIVLCKRVPMFEKITLYTFKFNFYRKLVYLPSLDTIESTCDPPGVKFDKV